MVRWTVLLLILFAGDSYGGQICLNLVEICWDYSRCTNSLEVIYRDRIQRMFLSNGCVTPLGVIAFEKTTVPPYIKADSEEQVFFQAFFLFRKNSKDFSTIKVDPDFVLEDSHRERNGQLSFYQEFVQNVLYSSGGYYSLFKKALIANDPKARALIYAGITEKLFEVDPDQGCDFYCLEGADLETIDRVRKAAPDIRLRQSKHRDDYLNQYRTLKSQADLDFRKRLSEDEKLLEQGKRLSKGSEEAVNFFINGVVNPPKMIGMISDEEMREMALRTMQMTKPK